MPLEHADIRVVRELRSGVGSYEIAAAVNELLRRGWVLLGAGFIAQPTTDCREFLYVLGAADAALLGDDAPAASPDYSEMAAFVRSVGADTDKAWQ